MKKILLTSALFISIFTHAQSDVQISQNLTYNGESSLAVDPLNPQRMAVGFMQVTAYNPVRISIAVSRSSDGGQTWLGPVFLPMHGSYNTTADPTFQFGKDGILYAGYINFKTTHDSGAVYVCKSSNGGQTFDNGHIVINGLQSPDFPVDRPWMAIDESSSSPYGGRIYVVTKSYKDGPLPHHVWLMTSTDSANSWSAPLWVDDSIKTGLITNSMGVPAVAADGKLFIEYVSWDTAVYFAPQIVFARSDNGGASLTYHPNNAVYAPNSGIPAADSFYQGSYHLAANPINQQQLISIFTDNRNGDPDIYLFRSNDEGATWTAPVRLNDDPVSNGKGQDMCWGGFSPGGVYAALWRDRRNASTTGQNADFMIYGAASTNGGATFLPNFQLSSGTSHVIPVAEGNDFIGVGVTDSCIISTWAGLPSGNLPFIYANHDCALALGIPQQNIIPQKIFYNTNEKSIHVDADAGAKVAVVDMNGKTVYEGTAVSRPLIIPARNWAKGVYAVRVIDGEKMSAVKVVVE